MIVVLTDDGRSDGIAFMPVTLNRLADEGLHFTNGFATTPLCGPSRASLLTGRYAHNHGTTGNDVRDFDPSSTLATRMQEAGYTTGLVGKYLNLYHEIAPAVPPGWDTWRAFETAAYYDYTLIHDGVAVAHGDAPEDYSTDVMREIAVDFIDEHHAEPFFLLFSTWAPHGQPVAAPRHAGSYAWLPPWRPSAFQEADVSDKPAFVRYLRRLASVGGVDGLAATTSARDLEQRVQAETLLAVDDAIGALLERLEHYGIADDTLIVFTSDNGFHWGEHWLAGKSAPYEESIRVPLVVRYPRMVAGARVDDRFALHMDLAPTILELAGVEPDETMDGLSLAGVLCDREEGPWRDDFLLEYFHRLAFTGMQPYTGVRSTRWKYIRYADGFEELYDLEADASEMENLLRTRPSDAGVRETADHLSVRMLELAGATHDD